jgi:hypothetical protein
VKTLIKFEGGGLVWERAEGNLTEVMAHGGPNFPPCLERNAFQRGAWMGWSDLGFGGPWVTWLNAKQQQVLKEIGTDAALPADWRRMETNEQEPLPNQVPLLPIDMMMTGRYDQFYFVD